MKINFKSNLGTLLFTLGILVFTSCNKDEDKNTAPALPPVESMKMDFSNFSTAKSAVELSDLKSAESETSVNYNYSVLNVAAWNTAITVTLVVPVTAFANAFNQDPIFLGDGIWEWAYDYNVIGGTYSARLTGEVLANTVHWEMYISKIGIGGFSEVKWFEGESNIDGSGGSWVLNYNVADPAPFLQIDWSKTNDNIAEITYTNVREKNDDDSPNAAKGSFIKAGYQEGEYDAYYDIHVYEGIVALDFIDINIEWSSELFFGHVKAPNYFGSDEWQCWDSYGLNTECLN